MALNIIKVDERQFAPLFPESEQETLFLEIEERGYVYFDIDNKYGPIPYSLYHNRDLRWSISACLSSKTLNNLLDTLRPLLERINNGRSIEWNGNNNVGLYTDDAEEASREIRAILDDLNEKYDEFTVWDAGEWISDVSLNKLGVHMNMTEAEINEAARALLTQAHHENTVIKRGVDALASALINKIEKERRENTQYIEK